MIRIPGVFVAAAGIAASSALLAGCGSDATKAAVSSPPATASPQEQPLVLVTFSGEAGKGGTQPLNAVYGVTPTGALLPDRASGGPALKEARGMAYDAEGNLYVANANKDLSQIIRYTPNPSVRGLFTDGQVFADPATSAGIDHPYAGAFAANGDLLITSQDSFVATRVNNSGSPVPTAPFWSTAGFSSYGFYPGTWAPAAVKARGAKPPKVVPPNQGGLTAPRAVALLGNRMFVADSKAAAVKSYDLTSGAYLGDVLASSEGSPTGLLFAQAPGTPDKTVLYVGLQKSNSVVFVDVTNCNSNCESTTFAKSGTGGVALDEPSGLAAVQDAGGKALLVASRKGFAINRYPLGPAGAVGASVLVKDLPDTPEQLLAVN